MIFIRTFVLVMTVGACAPPLPASPELSSEETRLVDARAEAAKLRAEIAVLESKLEEDEASISEGLATIDDLQRRIRRAEGR